MAYCSNCGHELPEGKNFCPECGAAVNSSKNTEEPPVSTPPRVRVPQESVSMLDKYGTWIGLGLLLLSLYCVTTNPPVLTVLLAAIILAGCIYCLSRKIRKKGFVIAAIVFSVLSLASGFSRMNRPASSESPARESQTVSEAQTPSEPAKEESQKDPDKEAEAAAKEEEKKKEEEQKRKEEEEKKAREAEQEKEKQKEEEQAEEAGEEYAEKEEEKSSDGVDPDLKAFLDSYEEFVDEYVAFMKKYSENPDNMIAMLGDYSQFMQKYADFAEQIEAYDEKTEDMSTADYKYYIEVTTRCAQKMLEAAGSM